MSETVNAALAAFERVLDRRVLAALEVCARCGICADSCHVFASTGEFQDTPTARSEAVRRFYRRRHDPLGQIFPWWVRAKDATEEDLDALTEAAFATCTLCQRCAMNCPLGVDTALIMKAARAMLTAVGKAPEMLVQLADAAIVRGENPDLFREVYKEIVAEATRLGVKQIVLTECGHAYAALRWEAPNWFGRDFPFRVRSIVDVLAEYIQQGRLPLDPSANPEPVTYHDSCNLGRKGGLLEEPRIVLRAVAQNFREMTPNRAEAYCCGGGGGLVAIPEWEEKRLRAGRKKAEQIRACGAPVVATSCENCFLQIRDLSEHYNLGVEVTGLMELVVNALLKERAQAVPQPVAVAA